MATSAPPITNSTTFQNMGSKSELSIWGMTSADPHVSLIIDWPHAFLNTENMAFPFNATLSMLKSPTEWNSPLYANFTISALTCDS
jgi:hypothetical protein